MLAQPSSVDENSTAQKDQKRGQKGPFGSKSLTTSNLANTPLTTSSHRLQRRALGDISNQRSRKDNPKAKAVDRRSTNAKSTQTPFPNKKGLQETKTNDAVNQNKSNDLSIVIPIKSNNIDTFESCQSAQKQHDVDDDDEIEKPAGRTWLEQRALIDDSFYPLDNSLEFVNGYAIAMETHRFLIAKNRKEQDEKRNKLLEAYDIEMELELLNEQLFGGDCDESFHWSSFDKDGPCFGPLEPKLDFGDDWSVPSLPTEDLSDPYLFCI